MLLSMFPCPRARRSARRSAISLSYVWYTDLFDLYLYYLYSLEAWIFKRVAQIAQEEEIRAAMEQASIGRWGYAKCPFASPLATCVIKLLHRSHLGTVKRELGVIMMKICMILGP